MKAQTEIRLEIMGEIFVLSRQDAEDLFNELKRELGKQDFIILDPADFPTPIVPGNVIPCKDYDYKVTCEPETKNTIIC